MSKKKCFAMVGALTVVFLGLASCQQENVVKSFPEGAEAEIRFQNNSVAVSGGGVSVDGTTVTISQGGDYTVSGNAQKGRIKVEADTEAAVTLRLKGLNLTNEEKEPIEIKTAKSATIVLEDGTENVLVSGKEGSQVTEEATGAALFVKTDLTLKGNGVLKVNGYLNDGIKAQKNLTVESGEYDITSASDAMVAEGNLTIAGGVIGISTGEGSTSVEVPTFEQRGGPDMSWDMEEEENTISTKGIKCTGTCTITGGEITVDAQDDAIHADADIVLEQGKVSLSTGDDGMHAEKNLTIKDGSVQITKSNEGLEANRIFIHKGTVDLVSYDDGMNAYGGQNNMGGGPGGGSTKTTEETPQLSIYGGTVHVDSEGDGLDSNGELLIEGGEIVVDGPVSSGNGALDIGTENGGFCRVTGGTVLALGAAGMAESFDDSSTQASFCYNHTETIVAGSQVEICDAKGKSIYSYKTKKDGSSIVFSSPELKKGQKYTLKINDESVEISQDKMAVTEGESGGGFGGGFRGGFEKKGDPGAGRGPGDGRGVRPQF
nr:carbohydrate-binding domain-containing protein [Eubacterium sp.]